MGGEWLFCDGNRNENTGRNDHKIRTTHSPHVPFSSNAFVAQQKHWPSETEIHHWWISHTSQSKICDFCQLPSRGAFLYTYKITIHK